MAASTAQLVAHVLRRTTFGPYPGQVEAYARKGPEKTIAAMLARHPLPTSNPPDLTNDGSSDPVKWWLTRMASHRAGVHEKMTWFWHGVVPISHSKVYWWQVEWPAHVILRRYVMGSYRSFLKKITVTPAMLVYLDGSWSTVQGPNENYARELQELFTIGQERVTETNVQHAALALAGWHTDYDTAKAVFIDERWASLGANQKVSVLGKHVYRADGVVDAACDQSATARFLANKAWLYLVGRKPSSTTLDSLARKYRNAGLDNRTLVTAILEDPKFLSSRFTRPRYPVEWVIAAMAAMGLDSKQMMLDTLWGMGQVPFYPPNVAGWPTGDRWVSPSLALAKAAMAVDSPAIKSVVQASDPVAAALQRCSIYELTSQTRRALRHVANDTDLSHRKSDRARILLALCLSSPEFCLA
jgi:uncharacterized protein (DUF1800 family)